MKTPLLLRPAIRVASIICIVVIFFIVYNNFLLDKSLAALDVSLQALKMGETAGASLLLNIDSVNEVTKPDFDESRVAKLDYVGSTIKERSTTEDVGIVLSNLIDEKKKQKMNLVKVLDNATLALKRTTSAGASAITAKDKKRRVKELLEEATAAHYKGEFDRAKTLYLEIIDKSGATYYGNIAKALLASLDKQSAILQKRTELTSQLKQLSDKIQILDACLELGKLEMQLFNFPQAIDYFDRILQEPAGPEIAAKAKFYMAWANKQTGNLDKSMVYFEELINESKDEKFITTSRFQVADTLKRKGEFEKAAQMFKDLAQQHSDSKMAPVSLIFSKYTYLFDLNDTEKANEVAMELISSHPDSDLLESVRKQTKIKGSPLEKLTTTKEAVGEDALTKLWSTVPVLKDALKLAEEAAVWYAIYMIEGSIDLAIQQNIKKGDDLIIDIDPAFLTNYVKKGLDRAATAAGLSMSGFMLEFPERGYIKVSGFVKIGPKNFKFYVLGRMTLERHIEMDFIKGEYNPEKWIILTVLEGKLGSFNAPVSIANKIMAKAHKVFNQKQVFKIERFSLTKEKIYFAGPVLYTQDELKRQRNLLDQYLKIYK